MGINQIEFSKRQVHCQDRIVTFPRITDHYQCTTQADRDVESREWFNKVTIFREINMNENESRSRWEKVDFESKGE